MSKSVVCERMWLKHPGIESLWAQSCGRSVLPELMLQPHKALSGCTKARPLSHAIGALLETGGCMAHAAGAPEVSVGAVKLVVDLCQARERGVWGPGRGGGDLGISRLHQRPVPILSLFFEPFSPVFSPPQSPTPANWLL